MYPQSFSREAKVSNTLDFNLASRLGRKEVALFPHMLHARKLGNVPSLNQIKIRFHVRQIYEKREERCPREREGKTLYGEIGEILSVREKGVTPNPATTQHLFV